MSQFTYSNHNTRSNGVCGYVYINLVVNNTNSGQATITTVTIFDRSLIAEMCACTWFQKFAHIYRKPCKKFLGTSQAWAPIYQKIAKMPLLSIKVTIYKL